ncbi:MAG TPA: fumarate hydratase C-terminal domain-containing protein, partial [Clostridiales bacterium]|nr:fumarate hydratase C-terminal domain-containing protein [Clostridiales bacterium]
NGLCAMIGKGERSESVAASIIKNRAVYFCAVGGAGALYSKHISSCEVIAFEELGCESIKRLNVKEMPLIVAIDSKGGNIFKSKRY